jgi:N-acetylglutamate synthase-like GNAT family acetyltransferase
MSTIIIQPCSREETGRIDEIINDSATAYKGVIPDDRWHEPYMPLAELKREIQSGVRFHGYYENGELIGVMGIQDVQDVTLIRHAYVLSRRRNGGVGSQLLRHLVNMTQRPVLIGTWAAATWAIAFYQRHGFRMVDEVRKTALLKRYWTISERQIETSVVLEQSSL